MGWQDISIFIPSRNNIKASINFVDSNISYSPNTMVHFAERQ